MVFLMQPRILLAFFCCEGTLLSPGQLLVLQNPSKAAFQPVSSQPVPVPWLLSGTKMSIYSSRIPWCSSPPTSTAHQGVSAQKHASLSANFSQICIICKLTDGTPCPIIENTLKKDGIGTIVHPKSLPQSPWNINVIHQLLHDLQVLPAGPTDSWTSSFLKILLVIWSFSREMPLGC